MYFLHINTQLSLCVKFGVFQNKLFQCNCFNDLHKNPEKTKINSPKNWTMRERETEEGVMRRWGWKRKQRTKSKRIVVSAIIRTTAVNFSTIMSNINPHFRRFDSKVPTVEGEPPPVLHVETASTAGKSSLLSWINYLIETLHKIVLFVKCTTSATWVII